MKREAAFTALLALWLAGTASAQVVSMEGEGLDRDSALRDAQRRAVEYVAGSYVDARTLTENSSLVLDEIYGRALGFVRSSRILQEEAVQGGWRVLASVDVNTEPDSVLVNQLRTLLSLNDPRMAVVVLEDGARAELMEQALNERLIGMGFSHVLDTSLAAALQDAQLLQRIAEGERLGGEIGASLGADYLVLGKVEAQARPINLADGHGGYRQTQLMTGQADMTVRLIRFSTGELVEAFAVEGQGVDNGSSMARRKARQKAALRAAEKLEAKFKKLSAQVEAPCQIIAYTEDYGKVEQLAKELRRTAGVRNVYIREHRQGKAVLEVSLTQRTETLARQLRQRGGELNIYVDDLAEGSLTLVLS